MTRIKSANMSRTMSRTKSLKKAKGTADFIHARMQPRLAALRKRSKDPDAPVPGKEGPKSPSEKSRDVPPIGTTNLGDDLPRPVGNHLGDDLPRPAATNPDDMPPPITINLGDDLPCPVTTTHGDDISRVGTKCEAEDHDGVDVRAGEPDLIGVQVRFDSIYAKAGPTPQCPKAHSQSDSEGTPPRRSSAQLIPYPQPSAQPRSTPPRIIHPRTMTGAMHARGSSPLRNCKNRARRRTQRAASVTTRRHRPTGMRHRRRCLLGPGRR